MHPTAGPASVAVDGEGIIRSYSTGYSSAKGLGIDGWKWSGVPAPPVGQ